MFEQYILERIHNMLKMFCTDPVYDKSAAQLEAFLGRMVSEERLSFAGDVYVKRAQ